MPIRNFFTPEAPRSYNLGRIAKGERDGKGNMVDLDYFRFQPKTGNTEVDAAFHRVYGNTPRQLLFKFPHVTLVQSREEFMNNANYIAALTGKNGVYYQVAISNGEYITRERYWVKDNAGKPRTMWRNLNEGEKRHEPQGYVWTKNDGQTQLLPWDAQSYIEIELVELNNELAKCNLPNGTVTLWIRAHNELNTLVQNMTSVIQKFNAVGISVPDNAACPLVLVRDKEIINAAYGGADFAGVTKAQKSLVRITPSPQLAQALTQANQVIQEHLVISTVRAQLGMGEDVTLLNSPAAALIAPQVADVEDFNSVLFGDDHHQTTTPRKVPVGLTQSPTEALEKIANANGASLKNPIVAPVVPQLASNIDFEDGEFIDADDLDASVAQEFGAVKVEPHPHMDEFSTHVEKDKGRKPTTFVAVYHGRKVTTTDDELVAFANKCVSLSKISLTELLDSPLGKLLGESANKIIPRILSGDGTDGEFYDAPLAVAGSLLWGHGYKNVATPQQALQLASKFYRNQLEELPF
jgi:hypothetical protein